MAMTEELMYDDDDVLVFVLVVMLKVIDSKDQLTATVIMTDSVVVEVLTIMTINIIIMMKMVGIIVTDNNG